MSERIGLTKWGIQGYYLFQTHVKWSNIRVKGIPKEEFLSSRNGGKVVSTLILRGNPQYGFSIPPIAMTYDIVCGNEYETSEDFYNALPRLIPIEYRKFLLQNGDRINDIYGRKEICDQHEKNKKMYLW